MSNKKNDLISPQIKPLKRKSSCVLCQSLLVKFLHVVSRCTGEVVDAYYLEMDNDDDEITDEDEDAKGGR
ncbi:hypothetical protein DY000_02023842 [Brassica cretica]|uniref:Uncharacterized protein n=1 Tax=Brassica cretica TaxID=69181 RepID=A0ABQ7E5E0_BRACR|nr:hypothetical protein DY000_02023842 [Brassica cretica]